jgi:serine/threonine protein kinase
MQAEPLTPGMVIAGKYVIERTLGRGGMGAVYVVSHANTGKRMALKVLLPELVHNADLVGRFLREAQVMGRLQHRHVVDVFDVGRDGDVLYIVMELLEGKPFSDLLQDSTLTLEETLLILVRAMEGVSAAHDHGVVHRDLKPDNIFVCVGASGRLDDPRVLDFGISKLDDGTGQQLTRSGVAMGTPYYMSIEQLSGQRDLDQRVDVYALGVILYESIAGTPPYVADSVSALAIRVLTTHATHLGELRPDLPPGLADVIMRAIARNRDDRHRSVRSLIEALRPFIPRSAGLSIPEGQGRPLRTPRSGGAHRAATPVRTGAEARVTPMPGADARTLAQPYQSDVYPIAPPPTSRAKSSAGAKLALVALGIALLFGVGALLVLREPTPPADSAPAGVVLPTLPAPVPTRSLPTSAEQRAEPPIAHAPEQTLRADAGQVAHRDDATNADEHDSVHRPQPASSPDSPSVRTTSSPTARTKGREPSHKGNSTRTTPHEEPTSAARAEPAASSAPPPAANPPASPRKSAEGRAGKLGSDEF